MGFDNVSTVYEAIGILILFFVVLYGAWYISRLLGRAQMRQGLGKNMTIIEVMHVGPQKTLQLVRVGDEYLLIGVTRDRITFVQKVDREGLVLNDSKENIVPFSSFLNKLVHREKASEGSNSTGEETDETQSK